jgi:hypothetical protein
MISSIETVNNPSYKRRSGFSITNPIVPVNKPYSKRRFGFSLCKFLKSNKVAPERENETHSCYKQYFYGSCKCNNSKKIIPTTEIDKRNPPLL